MTSDDLESSQGAVSLEKEPLLSNDAFESSSNNDDDEGRPTIAEDAVDTVRLGVPIFLAMLSWVGMKTTDSALLGHVSADALAAAAVRIEICVRVLCSPS